MASVPGLREEDFTVRLAHRPAEGGWSQQVMDLVNHTVKWFLFLSERHVLFVWSSVYFKKRFLIQTVYCPPKQAQNSGKAAPVSAQYIHWKHPEERRTAHPEPRDASNSPSGRCCTQFDSTIGSFLVSICEYRSQNSMWNSVWNSVSTLLLRVSVLTRATFLP